MLYLEFIEFTGNITFKSSFTHFFRRMYLKKIS